jgi:hypothetical protein
MKRDSVAAAVFFWLLVRALQLSFLGWGTGADPDLYLRYAQQWLSGTAYAVSRAEYPPGAFPIFLFPLLLGGPASYRRMFAIEMACLDLAACVLVLKCAAMRAERWPDALGASVLYTLVTAALYPVLYARFDLVPATLFLAAIYSLHRRRFALSGALLGAGGAVKLWPMALVPIWLAWAARHGGRKRAVTVGITVAAGALLASLPVLPLVRSGALSVFRYYGARGIQLESTWATIALLASRAGLAGARSEFNFGAFQVAGRLPSAFAVISMPVTVVLALLPQALAIGWWFRRQQGQQGGARPAPGAPSARSFEYAALGGTIGLLIGGKVLSPQFMLWIAPLLAILAGGMADICFVLAIGVLTTLVYPYLSPALEQRIPGHDWALLAVACRNLILVGWYCVAIHRESTMVALAD